MVRSGSALCGTVRYGQRQVMVGRGQSWWDTVRSDVVRSVARYGAARHGMIWFGKVRGMAWAQWYCGARFGTMRQGQR